ncbi:MAG: hypothetical protein ACRD8Z_20460 [Nitrososphaeraceae archaeon]
MLAQYRQIGVMRRIKMFIASSLDGFMPEKMEALIGYSPMQTMVIKNFISQWMQL